MRRSKPDIYGGQHDNRIKSVSFKSYKALEDYTTRLTHMNILVGPNNCGKSTILGAFRVLAIALRSSRSHHPEPRIVGNRLRPVWRIPSELIPISLENIHTDYREQDTIVEFQTANSQKLTLFFPDDGGCLFFVDGPDGPVRTANGVRNLNLDIQVVPVLGPLEHEEPLLTVETVRKNLASSRASRNFRNYWRFYPEGFSDFALLVKNTWPGMEIQLPEVLGNHLNMFCIERRISRELYWAGFGFQIWCQLLTHIYRASRASLIVIDEPEVYLHPDLQRQLIGHLRDLESHVLLATHSTEIMSEADPSEIVLIDKEKRLAERLRDVESVQAALQVVGSVQNITLTRLARNRRLLFVEGEADFRLIRRFARHFSLTQLSSGTDLTPIESGGFSAWTQIVSVARWFETAIGVGLRIGAVFDRDFRSEEEVSSILEDLRQNLTFAHIHFRKEFENYLLVPTVLDRALDKAMHFRGGSTDKSISRNVSITAILEAITDPLKSDTQAQFIAKRAEFLRHNGKDPATITGETIRDFDAKWGKIDSRMEIVPGKKVLSTLRSEISRQYSVNLTDHRIISEFRRHEVPSDLLELLTGLDRYRSS